jgi:glycopeptide antibiotics resistance protein
MKKWKKNGKFHYIKSNYFFKAWVADAALFLFHYKAGCLLRILLIASEKIEVMEDSMKKIIKMVLSISFMFYLFGLIVLLFLGSRGNVFLDLSLMEYIINSSNFIPFKTISMYIKAVLDGSMNMDIPIKNLVGNFIMFMPMGIYLPYFIKKINTVNLFSVSMIIILLFIEVIQLLSRRGSFDIDDFILNMLGAFIGYGVWKTKIVQKLLKY